MNDQTIALIVGVSKEIGIELLMTFDNSVNIKKFKVYLEELRAKYFYDDICIYFDNLSVHRSLEVRNRLDELSIAYVYSPPYSPDFNGIESVFSIFKNKLKRERLKAIVNEKNINYKTKAIELFNEIDVLKINECINFSLNKLFSN